jgi:hypothetical protein
MKLGKKKKGESFYILGYLQLELIITNLVIWKGKKFPSKSGEFGPFIFIKNIFN